MDQNTVRRESLLGWKDRAERESPSLLIGREEFDKKLDSLRNCNKELLELILQLVPKLHRPEEIKPASNGRTL